MGGETCAKFEPRSLWPTAAAEMERYHFSYLNRNYNQQVLNSWGEEGIAEAARRLGYRLVLTGSTVTRTAGGGATVQVSVRNDGWAAPYNPRTAHLVLKGESGTFDVPFADGADARTWLAGSTTTLTASVADLPDSTYEAFLALPSSDEVSQDDPRFAIRTANLDTWDAESGRNRLRQNVRVGALAANPITALPTTGSDANVVPLLGIASTALILGGAMRIDRHRRMRAS
jgi:hypothetical protein